MWKRLFSLIVIAFAVTLSSQTIFSIVIRHDRDDEKYLALGSKYPAYGYFQERVGCTLIAPQWAVTAAHTVENNPPFVGYYVMFGDRRYEVEKIITHPARVRGTVDSSADMALLKLKEPVTGIAPALLYERTDEAGKNIVILGNGQTGNGLTGATGDDRKRRGATNKIDGSLENSLIVIFDAPPFGTDLEGAGGANDSGSPAFYEENGKLYLLGVGSFGSGDRKAGTAGKYLTFDAYARVSTRRRWILDTMKADPPDSLTGGLKKVKNDSFPKDIFGRRAEAFFKAFNAGNEAAVAAFYAAHRPPSAEGKTPAERAKGWQELMDQYGKYEIYGLLKHGNFNYSFLVFAPREKIWRGVLLEFEEAAPHRVIGIGMWDAAAPNGLAKR
jgi:hypothetical protein